MFSRKITTSAMEGRMSGSGCHMHSSSSAIGGGHPGGIRGRLPWTTALAMAAGGTSEKGEMKRPVVTLKIICHKMMAKLKTSLLGESGPPDWLLMAIGESVGGRRVDERKGGEEKCKLKLGGCVDVGGEGLGVKHHVGIERVVELRQLCVEEFVNKEGLWTETKMRNDGLPAVKGVDCARRPDRELHKHRLVPWLILFAI